LLPMQICGLQPWLGFSIAWWALFAYMVGCLSHFSIAAIQTFTTFLSMYHPIYSFPTLVRCLKTQLMLIIFLSLIPNHVPTPMCLSCLKIALNKIVNVLCWKRTQQIFSNMHHTTFL
jgi:hypothetical protein